MSNQLLAHAEAIAATEPDEALRIANKILNDDHNNARALFVAGYVMMKAERFGLAYAIFKQTIALAPAVDACYNNAGMCAIACKDGLEEGEKLLRKALKMSPGNMAALNNMALAHVHKCDPHGAIKYAKESLKHNPEQPEAWESLGYANLILGNWADGWDGYERSVGNSKYRKDFQYNAEPYWKGQTGGKLIVRGEQGIGDELSFASCLPDAMAQNTVTLECDKRLEGLFKRSFPSLEVVGTRFDKTREWTESREWDYHCLIGSLAARYRRDAASFPGKPYLVADPERKLQWRTLLDTLPGRKVGIAWTGGLPNTFRHRRSFSLESILPILKVEGNTFVSLQYRNPAYEIAMLEEKHGLKVRHWARAAEAVDYDETAALVSELDLVITTTTALAHLCGALGKECWVMVPSKPRWFYGLKGDTLPWYGSLKLYRQSDKWPVERIAADLKARP